jgi:hypothetical protein
MTFNSSMIPLYYNSIAIEALKSYNIEQLPQFEVPPGFGRKVRIPWLGVSKDQRMPPVNTWELKLYRICCAKKVTDEQVITGNASLTQDVLVDSILSNRPAWGQVAKPRNYYLTNLAQVYISSDPSTCTSTIAWKCWYVVLPKQWRKKLWKARGGKVA